MEASDAADKLFGEPNPQEEKDFYNRLDQMDEETAKEVFLPDEKRQNFPG